MLKIGFSGVNNPSKGLVDPGFERQLAHCASARVSEREVIDVNTPNLGQSNPTLRYLPIIYTFL